MFGYCLCAGVGKRGKKLHSTQKPVELLKRVILTSTNEGDLILDPMAGTGTTGYVAKAIKRNFVMIEVNERYIKGIVERFEETLRITDEPEPSPDEVRRYLKARKKNL